MAAEAAPALAPEWRARLLARARPDGFVPFDAYMDEALYADGLGFYARADSPIGPGGDFYTAAHVHPLFARSVARKLRSVTDRLRDRGPVVAIELGPGDGRLAEGVLRSLGDRAIAEYCLVERSAPLGRVALERARAAGAERGIDVRLVPSVAAVGPFAGFVFANELIDALPARRLRWSGAAWEELGVRLENDRLVPAAAPLRDPVPAPPLPTVAEAGTIFEVADSAPAIVREVADHLVAGELLLLDYGMSESELLAGHPRGTLEAIRRHRTVADPLAAPGSTDLSVFVNFDRIRAAAYGAGLVEAAFRSQAEALGAWGFPELLAGALREAESSEAEVRLRLAAKNLLFGFDRFRALELAAPGGMVGAGSVATARSAAPR